MLRLASLLWRLRRATAIESGLFKIQARYLLQFRQSRKADQQRQNIIHMLHGHVSAAADDLTQSFIRLSNLPTCPLDRLSRYEATLWRQACQILFALQFLDRGKPWTRTRWRGM